MVLGGVLRAIQRSENHLRSLHLLDCRVRAHG